MNLYKLLHEDHEIFQSLFDQLEHTDNSNVKRRGELFWTLKQELDIHAKAEEKFFYSQLIGADEVRDMALHAMDDHNDVKRMLREIEVMDKNSNRFLEKLRALRNNVERHVQEEEEELFEKAKRILTPVETNKIAEKIESFKEEQSEFQARS